MAKRFNNLSIYRLIATICVIIFHIFFILVNRAIPYEMLLSKGVQGLTCLSGFLYSQKLIKDTKKFYVNNLKKILIPALIAFLIMAIWNFIYMIVNQSWNYFDLFFSHRLYNNMLLIQPGNYYYIAYIFGCYLLTPVLQRKDKFSWLTIILVSILEFTLAFLNGTASIAVSYIIGYYLGSVLFKQITDKDTKFSIPTFLVIFASLALVTGLYILMIELPWTGNYFISHFYLAIRDCLLTCFGILTFLFISHLFRWTNNFKGSKFLGFTDKLSLNAYLLNQAFMCGAMNVTLWVNDFTVGVILVFVFTISFSIITYFLYKGLMYYINRDKLKEA